MTSVQNSVGNLTFSNQEQTTLLHQIHALAQQSLHIHQQQWAYTQQQAQHMQGFTFHPPPSTVPGIMTAAAARHISHASSPFPHHPLPLWLPLLSNHQHHPYHKIILHNHCLHILLQVHLHVHLHLHIHLHMHVHVRDLPYLESKLQIGQDLRKATLVFMTLHMTGMEE